MSTRAYHHRRALIEQTMADLANSAVARICHDKLAVLHRLLEAAGAVEAESAAPFPAAIAS